MKKLLIILSGIILLGMISVTTSAQEVLKRDLELRKATPVLNLNGTSAAIQFYNGDVTLTQSSNALTLTGGVLRVSTDTVATMAYARLRLAIADTATMLTSYIARSDTASMLTRYIARGDTASMLTNYILASEVPPIINDSIEDRITAATVGVALADSTVLNGGYATRTYVNSMFGSGGGLTAQRLPFIIGKTTGAPTAGDSTVVHAEFEGTHIDLYRDGSKQYQNFTATNTVEGFRVSGSTITVNPEWQANEQIMVDIVEPILWSYLSLTGEESSLLTDLSGYWKLNEASGTTATDAMGNQDGEIQGSASRVTGKLSYGLHTEDEDQMMRIPYNDAVTPEGVAFSVGFWIYLDSVPSATGRDASIFAIYNTESPFLAHTIYIPTAGTNADKIIFYTLNTAGTDYTAVSTSALSDSTWYNIVAVNRGDGQTMQIYVNGSDVTASSETFTSTILEGLGTIGFGNTYVDNPGYVPNIIDECAIWSRALTSGEVTTWYNSGSGRTHPFN